MIAHLIACVLGLILGITCGILKSRKDRQKADENIEAALAKSVRRADLGIPTIPINEIYTERQ